MTADVIRIQPRKPSKSSARAESALVIILPTVIIERFEQQTTEETIKMKVTPLLTAIAVSILAFAGPNPSMAQSATPGLRLVPLGNCQLSASQLSASIGLASCVRASFTGTGSGTALTTTSVTGIIKAGDTVAGTGVAAGTAIVSQTSGTTGGAGVYVTSAATTSSSNSLTSGGIPATSTQVYLQAETANIRYRDDGGAPTTAIGNLIIAGIPGILYPGSLSAMRFIGASGSPLLNAAFYR